MSDRAFPFALNPLTYLLLGLLITASCASIPREAPELSAELGNRISAIEDAHIALLRGFFDEKRNRVDRFVSEQWVPTFTDEFFSQPRMEEVWDEIVRSDNKQDRLEFLVRISPKLQAKISAKRAELVQPLDDLERLMERRLRDEYEQARAINNSITSFLFSASKVAESRDRYLNLVGASDERIATAIDDVDSAVSLLLAKTRAAADSTLSIVEKDRTIQEYLMLLNSIIESLQK